MSRKKRLTVPASVLERATEVASKKAAVKPVAPSMPAKARLLPREKVVAALKKLHPMD